jgi:hypothetical protein
MDYVIGDFARGDHAGRSRRRALSWHPDTVSIRLRYAKDYRQSVGGAAERRSGGDLAP